MAGTTAAAKEATPEVEKAPAKRAAKVTAPASTAGKKAPSRPAKEPKPVAKASGKPVHAGTAGKADDHAGDAERGGVAEATAPKAVREAAPKEAPRPAAGGLKARLGAPQKKAGGSYAGDEKFLASQRKALDEERRTYMEQARSLRAEADSLVEEMEPGDIQFDEESGEGGTVAVDRERDLALSAQALEAVEEIDHALAKIESGTYGICESCGTLIPKNRLEALPFARLCIACKSGGLSRR
jgi:DnaK suppressor protein